MNKIIIPFLVLVFSLKMSAECNNIVQTKSGLIEGSYVSGITEFKGVPFAEPPVGNLRWKAPQPTKPWSGVKPTKQYGPNPMQNNVFGDMNFGTRQMSEDCLYLNIWTPAKTMDERLPVLIYFNGGGLVAGSGSEPRYAGQAMARKGIVCITANYREGIFGFFAHKQLSKETTYKGSGNYGYLDQVAAIQWVKDNISSFGGDPNRITICGESAGSCSVSALMASPLIKNSIHQAIGSSGSVLGRSALTLQEAENDGARIMKSINCSTIQEMRSLSAESLLKIDLNGYPKLVIDGYFATVHPDVTYAKGEQAHIPLLVGGNSQEMTASFYLNGAEPTIRNLKKVVEPLYGMHTDELLSLYGINADSDINNVPGDLLAGDIFLAYNTWKWTIMHGRTGESPVYRYIYYHPRPLMRESGLVANLAGGTSKTDTKGQATVARGAVHSADIEYAMGTLPTNRIYDWQPEDFMMSDIFINYYANFIKTGNPNSIGLPAWNSLDLNKTPSYLHLDLNTFMETDETMEKRYRIIDNIIPKRYNSK